LIDISRSDLTAGVAGAGTMGRGIAQVLAQCGVRTLLYDAQPGAAHRGLDSIAKTLARLRRQYRAAGRMVPLTIFEHYDLVDTDDARPTYAELAAEHRVPVTQVTNWLAAARRDFRAHALDTIRDLTSGDEEFREEVRALLGREPS